MASSFVGDYDEWARSGYAEPIPDALREAVSSGMLDVLQDDQDWYLTGGIQQLGAVEIVEAKLGEVDDDRAVVTIALDASAVSVTARGEETFVDYSQLIVTRFNLERTDSWRIASTQSDE